MPKERRKFIYKLASGLTNGKTLQGELGSALRKKKNPNDRLEPLGIDGSEVRFINVARTHQKMLVGVFHKLTKGAAQIIINMEGDGEAWNVETVKAQNAQRPKGEFVEGSLYFGIWKNHVIIVQSALVVQFQDYVTWLLAHVSENDGNPIKQTSLVSLDNPLTAPIRAKGFQQVREIKIGGTVTTKPVGKTSHAKSASAAVKFSPTGDMWKGIKAIFGAQGVDLPADIELEDALEQQDVRVSLYLSCTKKGLDSAAGTILGQLGHALSHNENTDVSVTLADGSVVSGDELKVSTEIGVDCVDKLPVLESVFRAMVDYMEELVKVQTVVEQEAFGNGK